MQHKEKLNIVTVDSFTHQSLKTMSCFSHVATKRSQGFSLMEVLASSVILSIGLLGLASLHFESLKMGNESFYKSMASIQADDLIDRMRANLDGISGGYYETQTTSAITSSHLKCLGGVDNGGRKLSPSSVAMNIGDPASAAQSIDSKTSVKISGSIDSDGAGFGSFVSFGNLLSGLLTPGKNSNEPEALEPTPALTTGTMTDSTCGAKEIAEQDLFEFKNNLNQLLPNAKNTVCRTNAPGSGSTLNCNGKGNLIAIFIEWQDKRGGRHTYRVTTKP